MSNLLCNLLLLRTRLTGMNSLSHLLILDLGPGLLNSLGHLLILSMCLGPLNSLSQNGYLIHTLTVPHITNTRKREYKVGRRLI